MIKSFQIKLVSIIFNHFFIKGASELDTLVDFANTSKHEVIVSFEEHPSVKAIKDKYRDLGHERLDFKKSR